MSSKTVSQMAAFSLPHILGRNENTPKVLEYVTETLAIQLRTQNSVMDKLCNIWVSSGILILAKKP